VQFNDANVLGNYHFSEQVGHLLRRSYQQHVAIFQQRIADSQLTAAQFVTMCAIQEHGTCSLSDVVKTTTIDQATTRGIIERLRLRDLIVLSHDAADRRKVLVTLSPDGLKLVKSTVPHAADVSEATMSNLNPAERVAIMFLLSKMVA